MTNTEPLLVTTDSGLTTVQINQKLYTINLYNEDDALTQGRWAAFQQDVKRIVVSEDATTVHGLWYTSAVMRYQSMSISFNVTGDFPEMVIRSIKGCLTGISEEYPYCIIQWTEADVTYF